MNVEMGTEAAQFPEEEYINGIFRCSVAAIGPWANYASPDAPAPLTSCFNPKSCINTDSCSIPKAPPPALAAPATSINVASAQYFPHLLLRPVL